MLDPDAVAVVWANAAALQLWNAPDHPELYGRNMHPVPASVVTRLQTARTELEAGRTKVMPWVFFPKGIPTHVVLHFSPLRGDDGRLFFLQQATHRDAGSTDLQRMSEAFQHSTQPIAYVRFDGGVMLKNPAAIDAFGHDADRYASWLADAAQAQALLAQAQAQGEASAEVPVTRLAGPRIHQVSLRRLRDAVSGDLLLLAQHADQTARHRAEAEAHTQTELRGQLQSALSQVEAQHRQILTLSAPILDVGPGALALPIIGELDPHRTDEIASRLLNALRDRRAHTVLFDLTGATTLDTLATQRLAQLLQAVRLLGAQPVVTGIRPTLAKALIESDWDCQGVRVIHSLADAMAHLHAPKSR